MIHPIKWLFIVLLRRKHSEIYSIHSAVAIIDFNELLWLVSANLANHHILWVPCLKVLKNHFVRKEEKKNINRPLRQRVNEQNTERETDVWRYFDLDHCIFADCLFVYLLINKEKWICSSFALPSCVISAQWKLTPGAERVWFWDHAQTVHPW